MHFFAEKEMPVTHFFEQKKKKRRPDRENSHDRHALATVSCLQLSAGALRNGRQRAPALYIEVSRREEQGPRGSHNENGMNLPCKRRWQLVLLLFSRRACRRAPCALHSPFYSRERLASRA